MVVRSPSARCAYWCPGLVARVHTMLGQNPTVTFCVTQHCAGAPARLAAQAHVRGLRRRPGERRDRAAARGALQRAHDDDAAALPHVFRSRTGAELLRGRRVLGSRRVRAPDDTSARERRGPVRVPAPDASFPAARERDHGAAALLFFGCARAQPALRTHRRVSSDLTRCAAISWRRRQCYDTHAARSTTRMAAHYTRCVRIIIGAADAAGLLCIEPRRAQGPPFSLRA